MSLTRPARHRRPTSTRRRLTVTATTALVLTAGGGIAHAAIPGSTTKRISGCYTTSGADKGRLSVIDADAGQSCPAGTAAVAWSSKNPFTPRGAYSATTAYKNQDVVTSAGSSYVALLNNTGVPVTNTTNWQLLAAKGAARPTGPKGATGPAGAPGPQGPPGLSGRERVLTSSLPAAANRQSFGQADCPAGKVPLGGGTSNGGVYNTIYLTDSYPTANGWAVWVNNVTGGELPFYVYAICATVS